MRDPAPLVGDQRIRHHLGAKILLVQLQIGLAERISRKRNTLFRHPVGLSLKFLEHGLAVDRSFEAVQIVVEQVGLLPGVLSLREHVLQKQDLIGRGSDLRHKDLVPCVEVGLSVLGIPGVHGVPHLMDQCEYVVERIRVVEQHVRMHAVDTA